jgi:hypothetical protein
MIPHGLVDVYEHLKKFWYTFIRLYSYNVSAQNTVISAVTTMPASNLILPNYNWNLLCCFVDWLIVSQHVPEFIEINNRLVAISTW